MVVTAVNQQVNGQAVYTRAAPIFHEEDHRIHMIIAALDYNHTGRPLSCTADAQNVDELARACGAALVVNMRDEQCTREDLIQAIRQVGSKCEENDYFIFYFAGHGTNVADASGDEEDGLDEAFVCVNRRGEVSDTTLLTDDDFAAEILASTKPETRVVVIADCCHSGSIADMGKKSWEGREAVSISGCGDSQTTEEVGGGMGGVFTHSLLLAIEKLSKVGRDNYSVGMLFNATLHEDESVFNSSDHDLVIHMSPNFSTAGMAWPLIPPVGYVSPLSKIAQDDEDSTKLASPIVLERVDLTKVNQPVCVEEYVAHVQGNTLFQMKACRACSTGCSGSQCHVQ